MRKRGARGVKRVLEIIREKYAQGCGKHIHTNVFKKKSNTSLRLSVVECVNMTLNGKDPTGFESGLPRKVLHW